MFQSPAAADSEGILSQVQGTRKQLISLLAACFLPFKQSPESGPGIQYETAIGVK